MPTYFYGPKRTINGSDLNVTIKDKYPPDVYYKRDPCKIRGPNSTNRLNFLPKEQIQQVFAKDPYYYKESSCLDTSIFPIDSCFLKSIEPPIDNSIDYRPKRSGDPPTQFTVWLKTDTPDQRDMEYRCVYDLELFGEKQALEFIDKNLVDRKNIASDPEMYKLFEKVCFLSTNKGCPNDPDTGKPFDKCPNIMTSTDIGTKCRDWAIEMPRIANSSKVQWCSKNPNEKICDCINRHNNPDFLKLSKLFPTHEDYCWYAPCKLDQNYIALSTQVSCSNAICQEIFNITNSTNVSLKNVQSFFDCNSVKNPSDRVKDIENKHMKGKTDLHPDEYKTRYPTDLDKINEEINKEDVKLDFPEKLMIFINSHLELIIIGGCIVVLLVVNLKRFF